MHAAALITKIDFFIQLLSNETSAFAIYERRKKSSPDESLRC